MLPRAFSQTLSGLTVYRSISVLWSAFYVCAETIKKIIPSLPIHQEWGYLIAPSIGIVPVPQHISNITCPGCGSAKRVRQNAMHGFILVRPKYFRFRYRTSGICIANPSTKTTGSGSSTVCCTSSRSRESDNCKQYAITWQSYSVRSTFQSGKILENVNPTSPASSWLLSECLSSSFLNVARNFKGPARPPVTAGIDGCQSVFNVASLINWHVFFPSLKISNGISTMEATRVTLCTLDGCMDLMWSTVDTNSFVQQSMCKRPLPSSGIRHALHGKEWSRDSSTSASAIFSKPVD